MSSIPKEKLDKLVGRWETIQAELNQGVGQAVYTKLTKEFASLNPIVATIHQLRSSQKEAADLKALIEDPKADREMTAMAVDGSPRPSRSLQGRR